MTAADRLRAARGVALRYRTDKRTFDRIVREVLATLPDDFQERISNLAIVVEEWPADDADDVAGDAHGDDEETDLLGLYQGVPYGDRQSGSYSMVLPDRITIYRQPILAASRSEAAAREEIRLTVLHEIGHYFGLGDDELP
jgi:predicted Zn-dependent protease with MMP-like domain